MVMRSPKPWRELSTGEIEALPAQLGVYELADETGAVVKIGYAGGTQPFGMRSALAAEGAGTATRFRHEFTHGYLSRWHELLMLHQAEHGALPPGNADRVGRIGRLSPHGRS